MLLLIDAVKPAYYKPQPYKADKYDKAYDYAFEHYAHEAKEDRRRGLGYGETWEDNFERRHVSLLPLLDRLTRC